jgi:hypothetical protein
MVLMPPSERRIVFEKLFIWFFYILLVQISVGFVLLLGRKKWRDIAKRKHAKEFRLPSRCSIDVVFKDGYYHRRLFLVPDGYLSYPLQRHSCGLFMSPFERNLFGFLPRFLASYVLAILCTFIRLPIEIVILLFNLQYKAIIKPERLVGLPTQVSEAKG